ncbi:MAG: HAD family phosphatase [Dehalococcoidales bacterium]|nr:HAD family phosphatase [Dehalococcoidales bacterium]
MPQNKLRAVIWDMDGVIADTGQQHLASWQFAFGKRGLNFTAADFQSRFGKRNDAIIRSVMPNVTDEEIEAIIIDKETTFRSQATKGVKALPGAIELMKALRERGIKMAVASSAPMENIRLVLDVIGIRDYFQALVFGREVKESKPSPLGYLLAAEKLGVKPADCVVVEDAVAGVTGAKRGGMKCLAVTNTHPRESLKDADLIVDSLAEVTVQDLEKLFNK